MIISQINSGLGNQMFQYAVGRALSLKLDTALYLFPVGFENNYAGREFSLDVFNIKAAVLKNEKELVNLRNENMGSGLSKLLYPVLKKKHQRKILKEVSYPFDDRVLQAADNTYLEGYWQSEKYFTNIEDTIREDFTFKYAAAKENLKMYQRIQSANAVSLHIRRGDYAHHPLISASHGVLPMEYYSRALNYLGGILSDMHLFVFSDDIAWAKAHLKTKVVLSFVDINTANNGFEDMRLMAACKHHIIANSSFSWWGAWLNPAKEKIVIAPKNWFKDETKKNPDLLPAGWVTL